MVISDSRENVLRHNFRHTGERRNVDNSVSSFVIRKNNVGNTFESVTSDISHKIRFCHSFRSLCQGRVIFSDKFQDCLDDCKRILDESGVTSGYEMLLSPCEHIALPESTVHKALMRSVLVHIVNKQPAISEIYRILKPGGKFCAFEPVIRSNTRYWEILHPMYIEKYEDFKRVENEIMENPLDSLCNFDQDTIRMNLEIAGFSVPEVKVQEVKSNYVVQAGMVEQWFNNPPSPGQPSTKERYLQYFDEATVNKYMEDVQSYLTGREINLKTNAVFINATK